MVAPRTSGRRVLFVEVHDVPGGQAHYVFGWPPWSMTRAAGAPIAPSPNRSRRVAGPRILCAATESLLVEDEVLTMCTRRRAAPEGARANRTTREPRCGINTTQWVSFALATSVSSP